MTTEDTIQPELRFTTVAAIGGIVICGLLVLQDPMVNATCIRVAQDRRVRDALLAVVGRLGRETASEVVGRI